MRHHSHTTDAAAVPCGRCHAGPGRVCIDRHRGGAPRQTPHRTRIVAARKEIANA